MTSSELTEWMQFERITGPLGRRRSDIQAATIAAVIAGVNTPKGARKPTISDFLIDYGRARARKSPLELLQAVRAVNASLKGS